MTRTPRSPAHGGFSFVELLVVLLIGVVVLGLLATGIFQMRGRAQRVECANHLRLMGEAVFIFRDQKNPATLPASCIADGYATWAVQIAPFLPQTNAGDLRDWDLARTYFDQPEAVRQAQVRIYYCPARRDPPQDSTQGDVPPGRLDATNFPGALSDYACSAGDGSPAHPWTGPEANGAIIVGEVTRRGPGDTIRAWRGRTDLAVYERDSQVVVGVGKARGQTLPPRNQLRRGTSQTILLGEKHVRPDDFGRADRGDGSAYDGARPASFARVGGPGHGLARGPWAPFDLRVPIFGSYHPGVCQFLMADGSVRAIANGIDPRVLGRLVVRDDE